MSWRKLAISLVCILFLSYMNGADKITLAAPSGSTVGKNNDIFDDDGVGLGDYIYLLAKASKINLDATKTSSVKFLFKDVKTTDIYAKAMVDAQFLGFIEPINKVIQPERNVTYSEAKRLAMYYLKYCYKKADTNKYGNELDKDVKTKFKSLPKYIKLAHGKYISNYIKNIITSRQKSDDEKTYYILNGNVGMTKVKADDKIIVAFNPPKGYHVLVLGKSYYNRMILINFKLVSSAVKANTVLTFDIHDADDVNSADDIEVCAVEQR